MRYLGVLGIAIVSLGAGCSGRCGTYAHQTGLQWDDPTDDQEAEALDDIELHEICSAEYGSFGVVDLLGDGFGWMYFDGSHRKLHESLVTSGIFNEVSFPSDQLVAGTTLEIVAASAYVVDMGGSVSSGAEFTGGTVEILEVDDKIDDIWQTQDHLVRWDLTWGEPGVTEFWYTTEGEDWLPMSLE